MYFLCLTIFFCFSFSFIRVVFFMKAQVKKLD